MRHTKIGLFVNTSKANAAEIVAEVAAWLLQRDVTPLLADEHAAALGHPKTGMQTSDIVAAADMLLVLGGDGTLLSAAHTQGIENVPLLAINIGTLGFLTDASLAELYPTLEAVLRGDYRVEHRMMLEVILYGAKRKDSSNDAAATPDAQVLSAPRTSIDNVEQLAHAPGLDRLRSGTSLHQSTYPTTWRDTKTFRAFALNDVVIRHYTRLIELDAYIDGELFIPYTADGLIIATPSGSTGYSLSCAGTIVAPQLVAILLTPIAPHSLTVRPFIAHGDAEITVKMRSAYESVDVFVDGQRETYSLEAETVIHVRKAERTLQLIRSRQHNYYRALREKLMLGESVKTKTDNTQLTCLNQDLRNAQDSHD